MAYTTSSDGAQIHYENGVCDNLAEDEADAFRQIRQFLSHLPQNVWEPPKRVEPTDDPQRRDRGSAYKRECNAGICTP